MKTISKFIQSIKDAEDRVSSDPPVLLHYGRYPTRTLTSSWTGGEQMSYNQFYRAVNPVQREVIQITVGEGTTGHPHDRPIGGGGQYMSSFTIL